MEEVVLLHAFRLPPSLAVLQETVAAQTAQIRFCIWPIRKAHEAFADPKRLEEEICGRPSTQRDSARSLTAAFMAANPSSVLSRMLLVNLPTSRPEKRSL